MLRTRSTHPSSPLAGSSPLKTGALLVAAALFGSGCTSIAGVDQDYHLVTSSGTGGTGGSGGSTCVPVEDALSHHVDNPVAKDPYGVVAGDFDKDGNVDLAVTGFDTGNGKVVSILPGTGQGAFGGNKDFGVGRGPIAIAAGDVDKDGDVDLATSNMSDNAATVILNDGQGAFGGGADYAAPAGAHPYNVVLADVDSDGNLDLLIGNNQATVVTIYRNRGDGTGTFEAAEDAKVGFKSSAFTVADVTGDQKPDILVAYDQPITGRVRVLVNNGDATFTARPGMEIGVDPRWVTAIDLDADGDLDVAVANGKSNSVSVLVNNGLGEFAPAVNYDTLDYPASIAAADLDGDGTQDLAVVNAASNMVRVLRNHGDATFVVKGDYPTSMGPATLIAADLNGDGSADLAVTNQGGDSVSVTLNSCFP